MSVDLEEVRKYLITSLSKFKGHVDYEDGFQEGMIRAWKDIQAGNDNTLHVVRRAKIWASNYIIDASKSRRRATGTPETSKEGRNSAQGEKTRTKIQLYINEYQSIHGKPPTNKQICSGTGLASSTVCKQLKNMREGNFNHANMMTEPGGTTRVDYASYKVSGITEENENIIFSAVTTSFEKDIVDQMDFELLLSRIHPAHGDLLHKYYGLDWTLADIASDLGIDRSSTSERLKKAHTAVQALFDPEKYGERCRNNHLRTKANTTILYGRRTCLDCKEALKKKQNARRKPSKPVKTHCKKNHEIKGFKSGRRYCKICNKLSQYPGMVEQDIPKDSKLWDWDERP